MESSSSERFDGPEFHEAGRRLLEQIATYYRGLEDRAVSPGASVSDLIARLEGSLLDEGVGLAQAIEECAPVFEQAMGIASPRYAGLVNSSPLPGAALADLLISSLNNNAGSAEQSPPFAAAEAEVVRAFAALFRMPGAEGIVLPGGSLSILQGLLMARARAFPEWRERGPWALQERPAVYCSEATHFAVRRAASFLGLGEDDIRALPGGARGRADPSRLAEAITEDRRRGRRPMALVGSLGTTGTGAIDPLNELADLARDEDSWLHIDACYGGAALLLDELRERWTGIERADSVSIDPHKWFFIPMTAALLLHRHPELEAACFQTSATSYIPVAERPDPYLRGLVTSRRCSGFAVWLALRAHGWRAIREAARRNIAQARALEASLAAGGCEVLPGGALSVVCARFPSRRGEAATEALQRAIADRVVGDGQSWFGTVRHDGRTWMRWNIVNLYTRERHIDAIAAAVLEAGRSLEEIS